MPSPFLTLNVKNNTTPQVRRVVAGASSTQGNSFGSLETGWGTGDQPHQRVINFGGHSTFIACVNTKIFRSTDSGSNWTEVLSDSDLGSTTAKAGPYILYPNGIATLVILANTSTTSWRLFTSTDGITWSKSDAITLVASDGYAVQSVVSWRGSLYGFVSNNGNSRPFLLIWNTTSASNLSVGPGVGGSVVGMVEHALCVYQDRLFCVARASDATTAASLWELVGSAWVETDASFVTGIGNITANASNKWCLFADPDSNTLVAIISNIGTGWKAYKWDSSLTRTDITSTVGVSAFGAAAAGCRLAYIADGQDPGSGAAPEIFLFFATAGSSGTAFTVYRWNGVSAAINSIGSGGDVQHAMPFGVQYKGECFWTSGQRHINLISAASAPGGMTLSYKVYSPNASPDSCVVRFWTGDANDEYPGTPAATLSAPSSGTLSGGNAVTGIDAADNGSTLFTVKWEAQTDGFSIGDFAKVIPQLSTS